MPLKPLKSIPSINNSLNLKTNNSTLSIEQQAIIDK